LQSVFTLMTLSLPAL